MERVATDRFDVSNITP